jgi:hypothetical protein
VRSGATGDTPIATSGKASRRRTRLRALGTGKQAQKRVTSPGAGAILTCRQEIAFLDRYLAAEMNRAESARFARHLTTCRDCVAFLQTYKTTLALTKDFLASQPVAIPFALAKPKAQRKAPPHG